MKASSGSRGAVLGACGTEAGAVEEGGSSPGRGTAAVADVGSVYGFMSIENSIKTAASDQPPPPPYLPSDSAKGSRGAPLSPPDDWGLVIGSSFPSVDNPKYLIKAEIDDGGMGVVYEAHQGELGVVAIKVIKPRILGVAASERFLNEARAMAKVRAAPGIATIFDCDFYTDAITGSRAPFIVMEYLPGALPITTYANEHRLSMRARLELFQQVCEAVAAAHRADIIHRDLKPANVMVSAAGRPKVIDFGLAVVHDAADHAKRLPSERGGLFGTLEYMSPEQAAKRFDPHMLTAASDVYSLGVILYELLLGQLPYGNPPAQAVKKSDNGVADYSEATRIIREDEPVPPHQVNRSIHAGVEAILLKAMEKEPSNRYADAGEMSEAIKRHLRLSFRRDAVLAAPAIALATWLAVMSVPFLFMHTPLNTWFMRAVAAVMSPVESFNRVFIITVDENTPLESFGELDVKNPEETGFGAGQRTRPLFGRLCEKLATSECRVVALDGYYVSDARPDTGDDEALLKGINALRAEGIDWVTATPEWEDRMSKMPRVSGDVRGAIWIHPDPAGWYVQAALERDGKVSPSFALASAAVYKHPGMKFAFMFEKNDFGIHMTTLQADGMPRTDPKPVQMSSVVKGHGPEVRQALRGSNDAYTENDRVAILSLPPFPSDESLQRARADAGAVMAMSNAELRERCANKVVVIANTHADFRPNELASTPDGRVVPKSLGHALAIETLLRGESTARWADLYKDLFSTLIAATIGAIIGTSCRWRPLLGVGITAVTAIGFVGLSLLITAASDAVWNPIVPIVALVLAVGMTLATPWIMLAARPRRRVQSIGKTSLARMLF